MRTKGTFQDVYEAARDYASDNEGCPINPVVRRENGTWMLESGLNPTDGDFEISLETFHDYFWECYTDTNYTPDKADEDAFTNLLSDE